MIPTDKPTDVQIAFIAADLIAARKCQCANGDVPTDWNDLARAAVASVRLIAPQEPVADDDAEWLRANLDDIVYAGIQSMSGERIAIYKRLERIANRLQAKAPETGEE